MYEWRFGCIAHHMHLLRDANEETEIVKLHLFFYPVSKEMMPMFLACYVFKLPLKYRTEIGRLKLRRQFLW
jgi:hypothetical protein